MRLSFEAGISDGTDLVDLINLTFNLDSYELMSGINDDYALGSMMADELYSEKDLGPLSSYIDYERYGETSGWKKAETLLRGGISGENGSVENEFNGIEDVPEDFLVIREVEE